MLFPILVIFGGEWMSAGIQFKGALTDDSIAHSESVAATLTSLSMALLSIDVALIAAVGVVLKLPEKMAIDEFDWALAGIAMITAAASIFCAYKFQMGMASQLALDRVQFTLGLTSGLEGEATLLLTAATALLALGVDRFRRFGGPGRKR